MAKTNGSRNFSDLLEAIQVLARIPMNQASSSFPSFNDDWIDSTYVAEYDVDDHHDAEDGVYEDEYNEFEDYDGEWIDMSGIPEDQTFELPELAYSGKPPERQKGIWEGSSQRQEGFWQRRVPRQGWQRQPPRKLQASPIEAAWRPPPQRLEVSTKSWDDPGPQSTTFCPS